MTKSVGVHQAKTHLSSLLDEVRAGGDVVITSRGRPVARLTPIEPPRRQFGTDRGRVTIAEDFDAPLPDEVLDAFEA